MRAIVTLVIATLAYLANPHGPLGDFWRPSPERMTETSSLSLYFTQLEIAEAVAFGFAVSLLLTSYPRKALKPLSLGETRSGFVALVWNLGNWWMHDSLHLHFGDALLPLLFIEYAFHATMMLSAVYLIYLAAKLYASVK